MFCYNCGKDCGDDAFCAGCGTNLRTQQNRWIEGMPCPYCGGTQIENGKCAFCDMQLIPGKKQITTNDKPIFPQVPTGKYMDNIGYIEIYKNGVLFVKKRSRRDQSKVWIPFEDLVEVTYKPPSEYLMGILCVRCMRNRMKPPITNPLNVYLDDTSIGVKGANVEKMYQVYLFLKECVEIANAYREFN